MAPPAPRQRSRTIAYATAAVTVAGVTAWLIYAVLAGYQRQIADAKSGPKLVDVVIAVNELLPGRPIAEGDLASAQMPEGSFSAESVYKPSETKEIYGQVPAERVLPGEVLRHERLDVTAARAALDRIIAPGARAVTVLAERAAGVGGLLRPADQVDVIVTIRPDSDELGAKWVTETILQNVRVLAIDTDVLGASAETKDPKKKNDNRNNRKILVTLEVMPDEAEKLALSASRGDLHLTLRGAQDDEILTDNGPLVADALIGLNKQDPSDAAAKRRKEVQEAARPKAASTPAPAPPEAASSTTVINGSEDETIRYDQNGNPIDPKTSRAGRR